MSNQTVTRNTSQEKHTSERIFGAIFGIIEALLTFRLIFRLLGANSENIFVRGIYNVTKPIVDIFSGIFSSATTDGLETTSVFEPATVIAMIVIALIFWVIFKLIAPRVGNRTETTQYSQNDDQRNNLK
jgi:hypothetical protein